MYCKLKQCLCPIHKNYPCFDAGFHINSAGSNLTNLQQITDGIERAMPENGGLKIPLKKAGCFTMWSMESRAEHTPLQYRIPCDGILPIGKFA